MACLFNGKLAEIIAPSTREEVASSPQKNAANMGVILKSELNVSGKTPCESGIFFSVMVARPTVDAAIKRARLSGLAQCEADRLYNRVYIHASSGGGYRSLCRK